MFSIDVEELSPNEEEIKRMRLFAKVNELQNKGIFPFHNLTIIAIEFIDSYVSEKFNIEFKDAT